MSRTSKLARITTAALVADFGLLAYIVRNDEIKFDLPASDPIFKSAAYTKFNPNKNAALQDEVIKHIPLKALKPEFLENKSSIVERFTGGVFGGTAYAVQRYVMRRKYFNEKTKDQLWEKPETKESSFPVGTIITDHFEVVHHTPESITVRCGDSPSKRDVRESDGLFQINAKVDEEKQELVLSLKSVFFQGLGKSEGAPMPKWMQYLHLGYAMALLENGSRELTTSRIFY